MTIIFHVYLAISWCRDARGSGERAGGAAGQHRVPAGPPGHGVPAGVGADARGTRPDPPPVRGPHDAGTAQGGLPAAAEPGRGGRSAPRPAAPWLVSAAAADRAP